MSNPDAKTFSPLLTEADIQRFRRFRITDDVLQQHQVRRVTDREARNDCGIHWSGGDLTGVVYPIHGADAQVKGFRLRRDHPEIEDGRPKNKYIQSQDLPHLYFELNSRQYLTDTTVPVIFVEAYSSALALACWCDRTQQPYLIVATAGCWGWRGRIGKVENENGQRVDEKGPSPDLDHIAFQKREAFILFDANASSNTKVQAAVQAFIKELQSHGAIVRLPVLPEEAGINGPDDYLSVHSDDDLITLLKDARTADNEEELLNALAKLTRIQYDQQRIEAAARLGVRVGILDAEIDSRRLMRLAQAPENTSNRMLLPAMNLWTAIPCYNISSKYWSASLSFPRQHQ